MELKEFYKKCKEDSIITLEVAHQIIYVQVTWVDPDKKSVTFFGDVLSKCDKRVINNDYPIKYVTSVD